eukprot:TRINITY_DN4750_c0_g2_i3.p1 TRINITY_DN4750_c0_g2~~TRINITY_DN4750_c0_g2_i3.p1  ORF type:complete len:157 (-),score=23.11 TRINITY_DN4750_c0_g2_i3:182-652(-)
MTIPHVTGLLAGAFGLLDLYYMYRVIILRQTLKIRIGDGTHEVLSAVAKGEKDITELNKRYFPLATAIRAHANFTENVPLVLVLLGLLELQSAPKKFLLVVSSIFFVARLIHGSSIGLNSKTATGIGRKAGAASTLFTILSLSVANIYYAYPHLLH